LICAGYQVHMALVPRYSFRRLRHPGNHLLVNINKYTCLSIVNLCYFFLQYAKYQLRLIEKPNVATAFDIDFMLSATPTQPSTRVSNIIPIY
jgi:hypothetical protein